MMRRLYPQQVYSEKLAAREIVLDDACRRIPRLLFMELLNILDHHEGEVNFADHTCKLVDCGKRTSNSLANTDYIFFHEAITLLGVDLLDNFLL